MLLILFPLQAAEGPDFHINLRDFPLYVKGGFDHGDIGKIPAGEGWKIIKKDAPVRIRNLGLEGVPQRIFLSPLETEEMDFTFALPFRVDGAALAFMLDDSSRVPGLSLAGLGDNWEIYLNGRLVREEMHLDDEGRIRSHRSQHIVHFPLDKGLFRAGENMLVFHIKGNPSGRSVGFFYADPYYIDSFQNIQRRNNEALSLALIGIYLFMGFYHLVVFFIRRKDVYHFFYSLFSVVLGIYFLAKTHFIYYLVPDTRILQRVEFFCVFLVLPLGAFFMESFCFKKHFRVTRIYGLFFFLLALIQLFSPISFAEDILRVWQFCSLGVSALILVLDIGYAFVVTARPLRKQRLPSGKVPSWAGVFFRVTLGTPVGNLIIGALISIGTGVFDILDSLFFHYGITLTRYGFFIFTAMASLIFARRVGYLYNQLNISNSTLEKTNRILEKTNGDLEKQVHALSRANVRIQENEVKYRSLFEGTGDPVALLDMELNFKRCNAAGKNFFSLDKLLFDDPRSPGPKLSDRLYEGDRNREAMMKLFDQCIAGLKLSRKPIDLNAFIKTPDGENKNCLLHMEYITTQGEPEIMIRTNIREESSLTATFVSARELFRIPNTIEAAFEVCRGACYRLPRFVSLEEADLIMTGLREMVMNALEHGNLEISHDEKMKALEDKKYFELLQERAEKGKYRSRTVTVEYSIDAEGALFKIRDEGKGFDHAGVLRQGRKTIPPGPAPAGRDWGIAVTLSVFDQVSYNEKGNEVILEKKFSAPQGSAD